MDVMIYALTAVAIIGLVVGYRRNSRNILLASALVLGIAAGLPAFVQGMHDGYSNSLAREL
jgi:uncharacterized membrane protein (UPF0136 family)